MAEIEVEGEAEVAGEEADNVEGRTEEKVVGKVKVVVKVKMAGKVKVVRPEVEEQLLVETHFKRED